MTNREDQLYGGIRLRTTATLAGARIPIVIDVGFGDATEPGLQEINLPVLLDMPVPHLLAYPPETVIAEKFEAMVKLGLANSRRSSRQRKEVGNDRFRPEAVVRGPIGHCVTGGGRSRSSPSPSCSGPDAGSAARPNGFAGAGRSAPPMARLGKQLQRREVVARLQYPTSIRLRCTGAGIRLSELEARRLPPRSGLPRNECLLVALLSARGVGQFSTDAATNRKTSADAAERAAFQRADAGASCA